MNLNLIDLYRLYDLLIGPDQTQEEIYAEIEAKFIAETDFDSLPTSDSASKIFDILAYAKMLVDQRIKTATAAVQPGIARGDFLENILGWLHNGERLLISAGDEDADPPTFDVYETDEAMFERVMDEFQGQSYAGPAARYKSIAKKTNGDVKDVLVLNPLPGELDIYILTHANNGIANVDLLNEIQESYNLPNGVNSSKRRDLYPAAILTFELNAIVTVKSGADPSVIFGLIEQKLIDYFEDQKSFNNSITESGIHAALTIAGSVDNVEIMDVHGGDIICQPNEVAVNTAYNITIE